MTTRSHFMFLVCLVMSGLVAIPMPCAANTPVTLKTDISINHFAVRLSDLFNGVPPAIDRDIAQAPAPCKPAIYDERVLNTLADTYRLDWQPTNGINHTVVTSACARITADMLREQIVGRIKQETNTKDRIFEITLDGHTSEIDLPADRASTFTLEAFAYDPINKRFHADLTAQTERGPFVTTVSGHVDVKRSIPVLAHRIEGGNTINEADLDWIQVPEERVTADVIIEPSQLIGRELRRDKAESDILHAHDVIPPRLVVHGSLVTMKIETSFMTVTAQGKAQQDGAQGETIRVLNTQSNRVVEGVVTAPGVVSIRMAQKLALAE